MNTYKRYQLARDAAWRTLLRLQEKRLPVDVRALYALLRIEILPFPQGGEAEKLSVLIRQAGNPACLSLRIGGVWQVFLRPGVWDENGERFALAHELGHMILHHETDAIAPGVHAFRGRENQGDFMENPRLQEDNEADMFAVRLLSPACVLHEMHLDTMGGIMQLCGLPPKAAAARAERMELLNQRDAFFSHPLERQVRNAFLPFIREKVMDVRPQLLLPMKTPPPIREAAAKPKRRRLGVWEKKFLAGAVAFLILMLFGYLARLWLGG